jgi:hydrophobic/amphiphilic exporter-1 (mainly G- bacteria), HAE1 family
MLRFIFRKQTGFILLVVLLAGLGAILLTRLPVQLYPRTNRPRVRVSISHPGYSAVDFSKEFSSSIESQFLAVEGVDVLEVQYGSDQSNFSMTFDWSVDAEKAKADVEAAMNSIKNQLPSDFRDNYRVRFFSGENAGFLIVGVSSGSISPEELYSLLKTSVEPKLNKTEDMETVEIFNVENLEATVTLRQIDMLRFGLTIREVDAAMREGYLPQSIGVLQEADTRYTVRFSGGSSSLYDVGKIAIRELGDVRVRLQDIADIDIRYTVPRQLFLMDGKRGIQITASPIDGGNIKVMSEEILQTLKDAREAGTLPEDTIVNPYLNPAEYIDRSISSVVKAAVLGAALAMLIVLLTLGELKNTLLIGISLPLTLILTFILMYVFKVSLNLISLGGMALAVGMVVDSSIVVMENIHRHRNDERPLQGETHLKDLIVRAVRQVRSPVVASTLTSILVFLPIPFTARLTNAILGDQAKVVIFALTFAMIAALTIIPVIAFLLDRGGANGGTGRDEPRGLAKLSSAVMGWFVRLYKRMLHAVIGRAWSSLFVIAAAAGIFAFCILFLLPRIPKEIISPPQSDRIVLFMRRATPIETSELVDSVIPDMDRRVRDAVGEYVESTYAEVRGFFNRFFVLLNDSRDADYVMSELQKLFVSDNTWYYHIMMWDPAQLPLPRTLDLQINLQGDDETELVAYLERIRDIINGMELYGWVFTSPSTGYTNEYLLSPRAETIDGIPGYGESALLSLIRRILQGTGTIEYEESGRTVTVSAEYPEDLVDGRYSLENFLLPYNQSTVPLKHFFSFSETQSVSEIVSENGERVFRVYAAMPPGSPAADRDLFENKVREELSDNVSLPAGYSMTFENPQAEMDTAISSLFIALAVSVALIYLLLAFQFNSLTIPFVILVTIPLGFVGLVFSLFVFKSTLSLNSLLGAILLSGIVVNNAIILIDFYLNALSAEDSAAGKRRIEVLVDTAGLRFTPIIITMLTTFLGMLPIAIGMGEGSNIIKPLGIAVSGGLFLSTVLSLFVVPSVLRFLNIKHKG